MYRNAEPEELASLHPSDRLMVQLIKIERLGPRIEGMLYRRMFDEVWSLLDDVSRGIWSEASSADTLCRVPESCPKRVRHCYTPSTSKSY